MPPASTRPLTNSFEGFGLGFEISAVITAGIFISASQFWWLLASAGMAGIGFGIVCATVGGRGQYDFFPERWLFLNATLLFAALVVVIATFATRESRRNDLKDERRVEACVSSGGSSIDGNCIRPDLQIVKRSGEPS